MHIYQATERYFAMFFIHETVAYIISCTHDTAPKEGLRGFRLLCQFKVFIVRKAAKV